MATARAPTTLHWPSAAVALLAGALAALLWLPALPAFGWTLGALLVGAALAAALPALRWPALALVGAGWALLHAGHVLDARLPSAWEGRDVALDIAIVGLPERGERQQRFEARVEAAPAALPQLAGATLRLGWFDPQAPTLVAGERWRVTARLRRPRGVLNPGGFDYERFALEQRVAATGYLRDFPAPERLTHGGGVDALRASIADALRAQVDEPASRLLRGLAVGDRRGLEAADWERLRATGLSHLLAISGLHIGLAAGLGALLARLLYALWPSLGLRLPRPQGMAILALPPALAYACLAGFGLPTQRALLMLGVVLVAVWLRRGLAAPQGLALAAVLLLVVDPLALLGPSFWLSFMGVAWLLMCIAPTTGWRGVALGLLRAQAVLAVGLLPLTLLFFGQASLAGLFANLVAVPVVSLAIVPLTLLGSALLGWPALAATPLAAAAWLMSTVWSLAGWLQTLPHAQLFLPAPAPLAIALALLGGFVLLLPRGLPGKPLGWVLLLPLLFPRLPQIDEGALELRLIDVGQGLSVLLRTRDHALLYDAGADWPDGLDMGEAAVVPTLRALGVARLDLLVASHADNDHAGGAPAVLRALPVARTLSGEPRKLGWDAACVRGDAWSWNGVIFRFLHPPPDFPELGNEASCVLRIDSAGSSVLLTGDIGQVIEQRLLREDPAALDVDLLLVPHHGSSGSSSADLIAAASPRLALVASGQGNRFGHPRPEIVARYAAAGVPLLGNAECGHLALMLHSDGTLETRAMRDRDRRIWRTACAPGMRLPAPQERRKARSACLIRLSRLPARLHGAGSLAPGRTRPVRCGLA